MKLIVCAIACASLALTGCTKALIQEVRHPGGYPGSLLDERLIDASEQKSVQLLRAAVVIAMAARMATATIRDGKDADAFAGYLASATEELNYAASNLYPVGEEQEEPCSVNSSSRDRRCRAYSVNFEADVPLLEARVIRLMLASLPENRAREFLQNVTKGDVLGAAWNAIRAFSEAAGGLRRSAAVFRSTLELSAVLKPCENFVEATDTVKEAAGCFQLPPDKLFAKERVKLTEKVLLGAFKAMLLLAETSCASLPLNSEGDLLSKAEVRNDACEKVRFEPAFRPTRLPTPEQ